MSLDPSLKQRIDSLVSDKPVVLFMKGNRRMPQCGFSATVVEILDGLIDEYETVDVLSDPAIRSGIKEYSDWPTIPQLYVGGEFQGGCDIVREMASSGDLHQLLGVEVEAVEPPDMVLTEAAAQALREAGASESDEGIRFRIPANYRYELTLGPKVFGDVELVLSGFTFYLDVATAKRAGGTVIDFVTGPMGAGFQIQNPDEPAKVQALAPALLETWLRGGEAVALFDVRTPEERGMASIEGSQLLDQAAATAIEAMDRGTRLVFYCHHGMRSQQAAEHFLQKGFTEVFNLAGGIDAWSQQVDASVPRY